MVKQIRGELRAFIHSQLDAIDAGLSRANQAVHDRPMVAAMQFVEKCLVSIGDEQVDDDYLLRDWFGDILLVATQWYKDRYGGELLKSPCGKIPGVVAAFGTTLSLRIPRISEFETATPGMKRIVFADGVLDEENPMEWVAPAPNIQGLSAESAIKIRSDVARVSTALRQIYRRIMVADFVSRERGLASSVEGHLEKAAADIQSGRHSAAIWEIHLCVEKSLKLLLRQSGAIVPNSHNLTVLVAQAERAGLLSHGQLSLQQLPSHGDAIRYRYEELPSTNLERVIEIYDVAIYVTAQISDALKPSSFAEFKDLYIKALPWHPRWKEGL